MIGLGRECNGLYYLDTAPQEGSCINSLHTQAHTFSSPSIPDTELWHYKLGHLSHSRLQILNRQFPFITYSTNIPCDICQFVKQKRLPFNVSNKRAFSTFEVLHRPLGSLWDTLHLWTQIFLNNY